MQSRCPNNQRSLTPIGAGKLNLFSTREWIPNIVGNEFCERAGAAADRAVRPALAHRTKIDAIALLRLDALPRAQEIINFQKILAVLRHRFGIDIPDAVGRDARVREQVIVAFDDGAQFVISEWVKMLVENVPLHDFEHDDRAPL